MTGRGRNRGRPGRPEPAQRSGGFASDRALGWVVALALLVNAPILGIGFVLDDHPIIERNSRLQSEEISSLWRSSYWGLAEETVEYRPFTLTSYALELRALGPSPFHFHVTNWLLHALVCAGVLLAGRSVGLSARAAALAAGLYAIHPVHLDVLAPVVGRAEMLAALGFLFPVVLWVRIRRAPRIEAGSLAALGALIALGAFSKENSLAVVPLLAGVELLVLRLAAPRRSLWVAAGTVTLVVLLYLWARVATLGSLVPDESTAPIIALENALVDEGIGVRWLTAMSLLGTYLRLFVWPFGLSPDYSTTSLPVIRSLASPAVWIPGLLLLGATSVALWNWRQRPAYCIALLAFLAPYSLVSNAPFLIGTMLAERLLYLPSVGLVWGVGAMISWALCRVPSLAEPRNLALALAAPTLALSFLSIQRARVWQDEPEVFRRAAAVYPENYLLRRNLGSLAMEARRYEEALYHTEILVRIAPSYAKGWGDRGFLLLATGQVTEALQALERSVALEDRDPVPLENLAHAYERLGRKEEARQTLERARRVRAERSAR